MHNNGLDPFYEANQMYVARQVVTNSKGEKVEIMWNYQVFEDLTLVPVGHSPTRLDRDIHWEIFLWGEPPIKVVMDFDMSVPHTWFEYEDEMWSQRIFVEDQNTIPEGKRRFPTPKHPNCNKELWKSQEDLDRLEDMKRVDWTPEDLEFNIYHDPNFKKTAVRLGENETRL